MSWLDLTLMYEQYSSLNPSELNSWLDMVAKAVIDVYQVNNTNTTCSTKNTSNASLLDDSKPMKYSTINIRPLKMNAIWLIAPLIAKLPSALQGRVLKVAGQVLEASNLSGLRVSCSLSNSNSNSSSRSNSSNGSNSGLNMSNTGGDCKQQQQSQVKV